MNVKASWMQHRLRWRVMPCDGIPVAAAQDAGGGHRAMNRAVALLAAAVAPWTALLRCCRLRP